MTAKRKITDKNGVQVYPITHTKAVLDDNGNSVEQRLQENLDLINQKQLEVGAVPSDITPTEGSTNWVTSGGVFDAINVTTSDKEFPKEPQDADLLIIDEQGYAICAFENGGIKTKNFDSEQSLKPENELNTDFCITDEDDNAIVSFRDGHVKTKNFDSKKLPENIDSTFAVIENEIVALHNEIANIPAGADDANKYLYKYQGERIQIAGGMYAEYILDYTVASQSVAYYSGYAILMGDGGATQVVNVAERSIVATISVPLSGYHANSINFGNERYDESDYFPLLYVSGENINVHSVKVVRVQKDANDNFIFTVVQTITIPDPADNQYPYYPNCFIDIQESKLYIEGYAINSYSSAENNGMLMLEYNLPKLSAGDVSLGNPISRVTGDFHKQTQDGFIKDGKLYQAFNSIPQFTVRKLSDLTLLSYFSISVLGDSYEIEGLDYYQGNAVISTGSNKKLRIIYFK